MTTTSLTRSTSTVTTPATTTTPDAGAPPPATPTTPVATPPTDSFATAPASRPPEVPAHQLKWQQAVQSYQDKIGGMFTLTAEQLADGMTAPRTAADLTPAMRAQLQESTKELFLSMPVGVLAPGAKEYLTSKGLRVGELDNTPLKDLGKVGGEVAKDLAAKVKDAAPAAYYGVAAAAAVAVGAYGYSKGSAALEKLGIKPEFKTGLFNDQLNIRAAAQWDKKLSNPSLSVGADGRFKVNSATLTVGGNATVAGEKFNTMGLRKADAHLGIETENHGIHGSLVLGEGGKIGSGELNARSQFKLDEGRAVVGATAKATLGPDARFTGAEAGVHASVKLSPHSQLSGTANYALDDTGEILRGTQGVKLTAPRISLEVESDMARGGTVSNYRLSGAYTSGALSLSALVNLDGKGTLKSGVFSAERAWRDNLSLASTATFGVGGTLESTGVRGSYTQDNFRLSAAVDHDYAESLTSASLSAGYRPHRDLDMALKGTYTSNKDVQVGFGMTWRF